eukprot:1566684-Pyramimonas_sp.AAC.1
MSAGVNVGTTLFPNVGNAQKTSSSSAKISYDHSGRPVPPRTPFFFALAICRQGSCSPNHGICQRVSTEPKT